jgi:hypothetical protein
MVDGRQQNEAVEISIDWTRSLVALGLYSLVRENALALLGALSSFLHLQHELAAPSLSSSSCKPSTDGSEVSHGSNAGFCSKNGLEAGARHGQFAQESDEEVIK